MDRDPVAVLRDAVQAMPSDVVLRMRLVDVLIDRSEWADAMDQCIQVLAIDPANGAALNALRAITNALQAPPAPREPETPAFDWNAREADFHGLVEPPYVSSGAKAQGTVPDGTLYSTPATKKLSDVAGMDAVKQQIESSFLAPLRNPEVAKLYGISAHGGLLLYGPPGCGKTFIASAIAGEIGANFFAVGIHEVLDIYTGSSEQNMHAIFQAARASTPCVLFFDELDALGQNRSRLRNAVSVRQTVNQFLTELDSAAGDNDGVYVVGATNLPWDVDPALRRPGRFDKMLLVTPPDAAAREAIIRSRLDDKPIAGIDLVGLVAATDGFSGADVAYMCDQAARLAMTDAISSGAPRYITDADVRSARDGITPSTSSWIESARAVVEFGNNDGSFDALADYLKRTPSRKRRWGR